MTENKIDRPLSGIRVIGLEQYMSGPYCSMLLADAGAEVIKIERPGGDFARYYDNVVNGGSAYFVWLNRGKESIELNIKEPNDHALMLRLIAKADVFVQNMGVGAAARAGFDAETLRRQFPRLITCDLSGYVKPRLDPDAPSRNEGRLKPSEVPGLGVTPDTALLGDPVLDLS